MSYVISEECITCGACIDECQVNAILEEDDIYVIDQDECTECGDCADICPVEAIVEE